MSENSGPTTSPASAIFLNTDVPNLARIFDYLAGGSINYEIDRQAATAMLSLIPSLAKWVRLRRAFIQEAASQLHDAGFRQFLDFGSGMPADDHIHAFAPEARVVFSDLNPVAISYGQGLFAGQERVAYIRGDVRQIEQIFAAPEVRRLINRQQPVAIGLNGVILFLNDEDNRRMAQALYDWAPVGSKIFMVFQVRAEREMPAAYEQFRQMCRAAGLPIELYTYSQSVAMMHPWRPANIQPIVDFLALPPDFITPEDETDIGLAFYAAFLEK
ncbi:MAG: SAM-dependent methyltransferase [Anaerolineae bacterium]|nr:SAM-dependent methyltransferase [Anaerolineae bacterium]